MLLDYDMEFTYIYTNRFKMRTYVIELDNFYIQTTPVSRWQWLELMGLDDGMLEFMNLDDEMSKEKIYNEVLLGERNLPFIHERDCYVNTSEHYTTPMPLQRRHELECKCAIEKIESEAKRIKKEVERIKEKRERFEKEKKKRESIKKGVERQIRGEWDCPVESISWFKVQEFIEKLNKKSNKGGTYRLPTEVEWEYTCRAGSKEAYCFGNDLKFLSKYAWFEENSGLTAHPIKEKKPNSWGIYDMHGNVWEWCQDWWSDTYPSNFLNPTGPLKGEKKILRGGSYENVADNCCSKFRSSNVPSSNYRISGFRLVWIPGAHSHFSGSMTEKKVFNV